MEKNKKRKDLNSHSSASINRSTPGGRSKDGQGRASSGTSVSSSTQSVDKSQSSLLNGENEGGVVDVYRVRRK